MQKATIALIQDIRRAKSRSLYPIKLRVIFDRKAKYYPTKYDLSKEAYAKIFEEKPEKKFKEIRDDLFAIVSTGQSIIDKLPQFSFKLFENKLLQSATSPDDLDGAYKSYIGTLKIENRLNTAISYECSLNSLKKFKKTITFSDIDVGFLKSYEKWMIEEGNSITTVGIYLRALRSVFNEAIFDENISKELYPFGKRKYQIPTGKNVKKALTLVDLKKIFNFKTDEINIERARDLWIFSYLCNGMNIKDITLLQFKNISGDYLTFQRSKTERSNRSNPKPITIYISDLAKSIISKWGNQRREPDNLIFPIISLKSTAEERLKKTQHLIKTINKWMKFISNKLQLNKDVTTYTARHSFSTVLKRSGASIEFISEALGHSNVKTTESYLDSFENDVKKQHATFLTAFDEN